MYGICIFCAGFNATIVDCVNNSALSFMRRGQNSYAHYYSAKLFLLWKFYHISLVSFRTPFYQHIRFLLNHSILNSTQFQLDDNNAFQLVSIYRFDNLVVYIRINVHQAHQMRLHKTSKIFDIFKTTIVYRPFFFIIQNVKYNSALVSEV